VSGRDRSIALVPETGVAGETLLTALKEAECGQSQLARQLNWNGAGKAADILANHLKTRIFTEEQV
jgi:hypothetical protein